MTFLEFSFTSARTVFVTANKNLSHNERGERMGQIWVILQFFLDELSISFLAVTVCRPRPYIGIVINELPIEENDQLVEEVPKRIRIGGAPRSTGREPETTLARTVDVAVLDRLAGARLEPSVASKARGSTSG